VSEGSPTEASAPALGDILGRSSAEEDAALQAALARLSPAEREQAGGQILLSLMDVLGVMLAEPPGCRAAVSLVSPRGPLARLFRSPLPE
jgi:hypothetical protein